MSNVTGIALSALRSLFVKLDVTADNIANANTGGFKTNRAAFQETSPEGVRVTISRVDAPGSPLSPADGETRCRESSNVAVEEERVNLLTTRHAFSASVKTIQAAEEMGKSLLDIKV